MKIAGAGNVIIELDGRQLSVYEYDPATEREYVYEFELDSVQTGLVMDQILSKAEIITPGSLVGGWLQQAFNNGLKQGRADAFEQAAANTNMCGDTSSTRCEPGCCNVQA